MDSNTDRMVAHRYKPHGGALNHNDGVNNGESLMFVRLNRSEDKFLYYGEPHDWPTPGSRSSRDGMGHVLTDSYDLSRLARTATGGSSG